MPGKSTCETLFCQEQRETEHFPAVRIYRHRRQGSHCSRFHLWRISRRQDAFSSFRTFLPASGYTEIPEVSASCYRDIAIPVFSANNLQFSKSVIVHVQLPFYFLVLENFSMIFFIMHFQSSLIKLSLKKQSSLLFNLLLQKHNATSCLEASVL